MMDEARFWKIVDASREQARAKKPRPGQDFLDLHMETLAAALQPLPPNDLIAFQERFQHYRGLAYRWDLWAAAYWLHGGCSDDGFLDFRSCLISLGKQRFFQVMKDPDALADIVGGPDVPYLQAEGFQYVAGKVYEAKTGEPMPAGERHGPAAPAGSRIDCEDEDIMSRRFPKIVAKFPDMGD